MIKLKFFLYISCLFLTQSCIDIIDELTIHNDGSGTFRYSINLSSSKAKVNSVLALDSLNGRAVPSKEEIKNNIANFKHILSKKKGISQLHIQEDYTNYLFKIQLDFSNIVTLQTAIKETINECYAGTSSIQYNEQEWITQYNNQLIRHTPQTIIYNIKKLERNDAEQLRLGNYTSITRFDNEIQEFENPLGQLSKNKKALLIQSNIYSLLHDPQIIDNIIIVKE